MISERQSIFVDTSAFVGLIVNSDSIHPASLSVMAELTAKKCRLITTEFVLAELANGLSGVRFRSVVAAFIGQITHNPSVTVVWSDQEFFSSSLALYQDRPDKNWSLTDCASFVVMNDRGIDTAFTTDGHFEQAGFVRLVDGGSDVRG